MKIYIFLFSICLLGCSSQKVKKEEQCPKIYKNKFTKILNEKYKTIYKNETISYNEVRFECVYSALYTHKVMFDRYGKWDKPIYPSNKNHPILVWKNVDLFNNGKEYTIMTNGLESWKHIYASIMVFDNNEVDLLSENSPEKEKLTNLFAELLKNQDLENEDFYEVYWKMVDPKRWETIKEHNKNQN
ncbi:hypothetical protein AB9K24_08735 [Meridianimaribacter flavus]|uniref:hypothetical protein n=1 Tax=Gaetbulibacter sp. NE TaxID=2982307 RepID=UPI0021CF24E8|nr:hypothetical protein [Gaetbulibacter sp. NE]